MSKKLLHNLIVHLIFILCITANTYSDDFDVFDDLEDLDLTTLQAWERENVNARVNNASDAILQAVAIKLGGAIKEPLWKNTRSPRGRSTLYLFPNLLRSGHEGGCIPFFNMTNNLHASINSIFNLGFNEQEAISIIEDALLELPSMEESVSPDEIWALLPLFSKISVQERKNGIFCYKKFEHGRFEAELQTTPFQMVERNFWLSQNRQAIFDEIGERLFPGQKFNQNKFVRMRFGPGDTRLRAGFKMVKNKGITSSIGASLILPTGTIGHKTRLKPIDLKSPCLLELSFAALTNVRDHILDAQLGNGGHFGLGLYTKGSIGLFKGLAFICWELLYDKFFPSLQDRLLLYKTTITPETLKASSITSARENLQTFVAEYLVPPAFRIRVQPGDIFNASLGVNFGVNRWKWLWGYNFYHQQREQFTKIYNTDDACKLRIDDGEVGSTAQHKLFWETTYKVKRTTSDLNISWGSNWTVRSRKLGHDWTAYLKFSAHM